MPKEDEERVQEEGPTLRSVALGPSVDPSTARLFGVPGPKKSTGPDLSKPTLKFPKKPPSYTRRGNVIRKILSSSSSLSTSPRWNVRELSDLPVDYPLVRTNVYVQDDSPQIVADRICDTLRTLSITANLDEFERENNALIAETAGGVKFVIRLFRNNHSTTVVEIQRRAGCSLEFRGAAQAILRSAKRGGSQQQRSGAVQPKARQFTIPSTLPKRSREEYQKCIRDDFRVAHGMLRTGRSNPQGVALEMLEKMTKETSQVKDAMAKLVLGSGDCLRCLISLLGVDKTVDQVLVSEEKEESSVSSLLRRRALTVLANSCEAIKSRDELVAVLSADENVSELKAMSFLTFLLSSLREADLRPQDAFQAARCLRYLLVSKDVETAVIEMSAREVACVCSEAGVRNYHEGLERESERLMAQLELVNL